MYNYSQFDHLKHKFNVKYEHQKQSNKHNHQNQQHKLFKSRHTSSDYLKNYIPFYARLDDEVNKSIERIKVM